MITSTQLNNLIASATGTSTYYKLLGRYVATDGIKDLMTIGECHWLVMMIIAAQHEPKVSSQSFQSWKLTVDLERKRGEVVATDGNGLHLYRQCTHYVDTPIPEIRLYVANEGELKVVMLAGEY